MPTQSDRPLYRLFVGLGAAWLVLLMAPPVWACPSCASRDNGGASVFWMLATLVLLPFFAVYLVARVIRRLDAPTSTDELGRESG